MACWVISICFVLERCGFFNRYQFLGTWFSGRKSINNRYPFTLTILMVIIRCSNLRTLHCTMIPSL